MPTYHACFMVCLILIILSKDAIGFAANLIPTSMGEFFHRDAKEFRVAMGLFRKNIKSKIDFSLRACVIKKREKIASTIGQIVFYRRNCHL